MTKSDKKPQPSRRSDALGVHSLDHLCIAVPDLAEAIAFYRSFGLEVREHAKGVGLYTAGGNQCWVWLTEGPKKRLRYLSFGVFEEDLPRFETHVERLGCDRFDPPGGIESNGIWLRDPDGTDIEIKVAEKSSPNAKADYHPGSAATGRRGAPLRSQAERTRPRRLAHAALFTPDVDLSLSFYSAVLGLCLSDRSADIVTFLHGAHGSDHHMLAFAKSNGSGVHHVSWDVHSVDDIGLGAAHMAECGYDQGWGLGRHVLGSNYFHYVRDPWGSYSEYSCDMDYVPADMDWPSGDYPPENSFYLWGPSLPEDFVFNYEAEG